MQALRARDLLQNIQAHVYMHMKEKDQSKFHRELSKQAYPEMFKSRIVKLDDVKL